MGKVGLGKSMSLDGYITGPNAGPDNPLGDGGDRLFAWMAAGNAMQDVLGEAMASTGAVIMGKRTFEIVDGPDGWVAPDGTPFAVPVFVLTHEVRQPVTKGKTPFTFVSDGIERALEQARAAAGDDQDVGLMGANTTQQFIKAGLVDEMLISLVPVFLGGGARLFDQLDAAPFAFESVGVIETPGACHLRLRAVRPG
jgi:dihydrofolate reductase